MQRLLFFVFIIIPSLFYSQIVKTYSIESNELLIDTEVTSISTKKQFKSNANGEIALNISNSQEKFIFTAIGFKNKTLSASQIKKDKIVYLYPLKESLDEVVVSNLKWKQSKEQISKKIISINKETLAFTNPQTTADVVAKSGNIFVQKSQQGGGSPIIRGFSTNRILISVDGVRMNNAIFRSGNLQNIISIDPHIIESAEIISGPGSVTYGSDAIGGILSFKTLTPKLRSDTNRTISGNLFYRSSSANNEQTTHADLSLAYKKWGTTSSFSFSNFDNLKQGSNGPSNFLRNEYVSQVNGTDVVVKNSNPKIQINSGYRQYNFLQKLIYSPSKYWNFETQLIYTTSSNFDRYDRLQRRENGLFKNAQWFYGPQKWLLGLQNVSYKNKTTLSDKIRLSLAYQFFEESRNVRNFGSPILNTNREQLKALSFNIDTEKKIKKIKINYGLEYIGNIVGSTSQTTNISTKEVLNNSIATRYPDGSTLKSFGAYTNINWRASNPLHLSAGIRYNQVLLNADFQTPELDFPFDNAQNNVKAITWSVGSSYKLNPFLHLKTNINTAFRAPNIDDVGKIFANSKPETLIVPNPNLKPEYAYNFSTSIDFQKNNTLLSIAAYYTILDDALSEDIFELNSQSTVLFRGQQSTIFAIQNSNRSEIYGFEFSGELPLTKKIKLRGAYIITKGTETLSNNEKVKIRHVPPNFGNFHITFSNKLWGIDLFSEFSDGFSFNDLAPSERLKIDIYNTDANGRPFLANWYTLNFRGNYNFTKKVTFSGGIENITDQRYRQYSSGISAPGLNLIGSLKVSF